MAEESYERGNKAKQKSIREKQKLGSTVRRT